VASREFIGNVLHIDCHALSWLMCMRRLLEWRGDAGITREYFDDVLRAMPLGYVLERSTACVLNYILRRSVV